MTESPSPERLRLPTSSALHRMTPRTTPPWRRSTSLFLKGPIPWTWLCTAARLPGRTLHVALWIRLWRGIRKKNGIAISISKLEVMGVSRYAAYRGLKQLEHAGLIQVDRRRGRMPRVTVIEQDVDNRSTSRTFE